MTGLQRGDLSEGIEDVAKFLNIAPDKSIFVHSLNISATDSVKRIIGHYNVFNQSQPLCYLPRGKRGNTSKAIILYANEKLLTYLNDVDIAPFENYVYLDYKEAFLNATSVQTEFVNILNKQSNIRLADFKGFTIVSSFLSDSDFLLKEKLGGQLIMNPYDQVRFNSKVFLRENAQKYCFNIPLGVEIKNVEEIDEKITLLKKRLVEKNIDHGKSKFWCKMESQSSGEGSCVLNGLGNESIEKMKKSIVDFASSCDLYEEISREKTLFNMKTFMPFVIEIDIESTPDTKLVANIGVEAVISRSNITLVGSVRQEINNGKYKGNLGRYIGSAIDSACEKYASVAEEHAIPVFDFLQTEGYTGFVTLDMLVVDQKTEGLTAYCIDPNARFSGGTMLLSLACHAEKMTGKKFYGYTSFFFLKKSDDIFVNVKNIIASDMYSSHRSEFKGILPVILNDSSREKDTVQVAFLSPTVTELKEQLHRFKGKLSK